MQFQVVIYSWSVGAQSRYNILGLHWNQRPRFATIPLTHGTSLCWCGLGKQTASARAREPDSSVGLKPSVSAWLFPKWHMLLLKIFFAWIIVQPPIVSVLMFQPGAGPKVNPLLIPTYPALLSVSESFLHTSEIWFGAGYMRWKRSFRLLWDNKSRSVPGPSDPFTPKVMWWHLIQSKLTPDSQRLEMEGCHQQLFWPTHPSNCTELIINIERIYACPNSDIGKDWSLPFPCSPTLNDS